MAFRAARSPVGLMRRTAKTVITTYGRDTAVASTLFYRDTLPGKVGRQMQTWVRFPEGWKIVAAHVSIIDEPGYQRWIKRHESRRSSDRRSATSRRRGRAGGSPRRPRLALSGQDHARRGTAPAARRRNRARRAAAGIGARRDRHRAALQRVAHAGPRGAAPARGLGPGRCAGASRRGGGAALDRTADRDVRGDGGAGGAVRRPCRGANACRRSATGWRRSTRNCGC